jgi:hypothetical protein
MYIHMSGLSLSARSSHWVKLNARYAHLGTGLYARSKGLGHERTMIQKVEGYEARSMMAKGPGIMQI